MVINWVDDAAAEVVLQDMGIAVAQRELGQSL